VTLGLVNKRSAGLIVYRFGPTAGPTAEPLAGLEVLIAHMGGPFWARKDDAAWSIPKGEYEPPEVPLAAALREFEEEMGSPAPPGPYLELGESKQPSGKIVTTFAAPGDFDISGFASNTFVMEWPRGSGRMQEFPEMDRAAWFTLEAAATKLVKRQLPILHALQRALQPPP
jgi:predicted NUDIX family NTP pyrophosphohydrolase